MPLKLNVGGSKKVGEANYGSRGASVNLELELDSALVGEPDKLKERIRQLFHLVRTSLAEELNGGHGHSNGLAENPAPQPPPAGNRNHNGPGGGTRPATPQQIKAIFGIARSRKAKLSDLLRSRFGVHRPDDLTLSEASSLIDDLKNAESLTEG